VGNAYSAANQIPNVLFEVVAGGALAGAVIPLLAGPLARAGKGDDAAGEVADRVASALLTWAVLVLTPVAVLVALAAGPLARLLVAENTCPGAQALAARMLLVFAPQIVLYGVGVVLTGILQAHHRFVAPALAPLLSSLTVIAAYLAFAATVGGARDDALALPGPAEAWLAWGTTVGVAVMTVPLLLPVWRTGIRLRPTLRFPEGVARRAAALAGAGVAALLAQQASVVAVLLLSRHSRDASTLNVFQYTQAVYLLPYAVLVVPVATSAFPRLAARAASADHDGFARTASVTTRAVLAVAAVGCAGLVAVAVPVAAFFAGLDEGDVSAMGPALVAMAPGLVGFALIAHVGRALYALERGRQAAAAIVAGWTVVVLAMIGFALWARGVAVAVALAAGTSVGMGVAGLLLLAALRRAAGPGALAGVPRTVLASGFAALPAGALGGSGRSSPVSGPAWCAWSAHWPYWRCSTVAPFERRWRSEEKGWTRNERAARARDFGRGGGTARGRHRGRAAAPWPPGAAGGAGSGPRRFRCAGHRGRIRGGGHR
jgi:putative peptidoglycan lipid II flippase